MSNFNYNEATKNHITLNTMLKPINDMKIVKKTSRELFANDYSTHHDGTGYGLHISDDGIKDILTNSLKINLYEKKTYAQMEETIKYIVECFPRAIKLLIFA